MTRSLTFLFALGIAVPAQAGVPTRLGDELDVGDAPSSTTVLPGDRVVAVLVGEATRAVAWRDAGDYTEEPAQLRTTVEARALAGAGTAIDPLLIVAGTGVETILFDTLDTPATAGTAEVIPLDGDAGSLVAVVWSAQTNFAYGVDDVVPRLHPIDIAGSAALTPVSLPFTPTGLALVADDLLVVIGDDAGAPRMAGVALDGEGLPGEVVEVDLTGLMTGAIDAITADGSGVAWIVANNGEYKMLVEITRTSEARRAVARGCASIDGGAGGFSFVTINCELPEAASTATWSLGLDGDEDIEFVYVGGAGSVGRIDVTLGGDLSLETVPVTPTGTTGDLALSSQTDGYLYIAEPGTGLLGVVSPGPWLTVDVPDSNLSGSADTLTFSITADMNLLSSCTYTVHQGGDFTGSGSPLEGSTGLVVEGAPTEVSIPAIELDDGTGRLFVLCADDDGDLGRASLTYYKGSLDAPVITARPGNEKVTISFDGLDEDIDHYLIYFDTRDFGATGAAEGATASGGITSPITISADSGAVSEDTGDDDDSADDTRDERADGDTLSYTYELSDLLNDTTYFFAVSAVDTDDNEGPRSDIVSARPGVTGGAAALAGDTYGCTCQNADPGSPGSAGLAAALAALLGLGRRRHRFEMAQDTTR